jgi:glycosyltransferase involved in cell wall biosynthesis
MAAFSIVIPAYCEEHRIGSTLDAVTDYVDGLGAEIIVVDDGSDDATSDVASKALASFPQSQVLRLDHNCGKGAAVKAGVLAASGHAVVFMDADLASDLGDLNALLGGLQHADVVIASRTHTASLTFGGTKVRAVMAQCFNAMVRGVVGTRFDDTQCGFKAFRRDAAERIFPLVHSNRFAFDVEVLAVADALGMTVVEVPVNWTAVPGTRVRAIDPLQMMFDLVRIRARCRRAALVRQSRQSACQSIPRRASSARQSMARGGTSARHWSAARHLIGGGSSLDGEPYTLSSR